MGSTFSAFKYRNYALFFCGQSVSQIGTWMQRIAVNWVVYTTTQSAFMLGVAAFAQQFPSFLFSLVGGIAADRYNRYKLLLITQTASMVQAVVLAILVLTGHFSIPVILGLSIFLGIVNAFDLPARQPLVHELVPDKADIPNALALNSSMVNLAVLVGPALAGIVLQAFGAGICFLMNAISFLAVLASLLLMKLPPYISRPEKGKAIKEMAEGFHYIRKTPSIRTALLSMAAVSLFVLSYNTLVPVFAKEVFKGDASTFGYINSFIGLGAISGTLLLATFRNKDHSRLLLINTIVLGIGLIFFSLTSNFPLAMVFAVLSGFGSMSQTTLCLTIVQLYADSRMRGRVLSYVGMAYFGMLPLGSLLVGSVSQYIGAGHTLLIQGSLSIIIAFVIYFVSPKKENQPINHH